MTTRQTPTNKARPAGEIIADIDGLIPGMVEKMKAFNAVQVEINEWLEAHPELKALEDKRDAAGQEMNELRASLDPHMRALAQVDAGQFGKMVAKLNASMASS